MTGVHIIALVAAVVTLSVIIELSRRSQLRTKYTVVWLLVGLVIVVFAIAPGVVQFHRTPGWGEKPPQPVGGGGGALPPHGLRVPQLGSRTARGQDSHPGRGGGHLARRAGGADRGYAADGDDPSGPRADDGLMRLGEAQMGQGEAPLRPGQRDRHH